MTATFYPPKKSDSAIIPNGILATGYASFIVSNINGLTIPDSVTKIEGFSFYGTKLTEVNLPNSITYIGEVKTLISMKLPLNIYELKIGCFFNTRLTSIELPESLKIINSGCFTNCPNLKRVVLPENLTTLNGKVFDTTTELVFKENSNFYINDYYVIMTKDNQTVSQYIGGNEAKEIPILSDVIEIKSSSFKDKSLLRKIIFETNSKLKIVQNEAFSGCNNIECIELPRSLTKIGGKAFYNCYKLKSITLSECTSLGKNVFENCNELTTISMEDSSLTILGDSVFSNCTSLNNIYLPISLTTIGFSTFSGCTSLTLVLFHDKISSIGNNCFENCNLEEVDLSICTSLTSISEYCFSGNTHLSEIKLPSTISVINSYSFSNTGILIFTCPLSLEKIYSDSFLSCVSLSTIVIPSECRLSSISGGSFRNCFSIKNITCKNSNYVVVTGALFDIHMTSLILFPPASPVKFFSLPGSTTNIGEGAFMSCINLVSIMIPSDSVIEISQNAFEGCDHLSCGCEIENQSKTFLTTLISISKLPSRCTHDCLSLCSIKIINNIQSNFLIHPFIAMLL
ncbi:surface antigen BspA-like [Trichomonas vaginalis G3]|uniref:Surface antigen BspA-like n=1 Tax=Trichomonas vaginalis (strain ATCC PRA-98 / G3) TaxID=412133 RepID=A2F5F7_TRIV3|nr:ribonuclease inhibitor domain-containing protein [Trichomonas vaginalis G3]EAX99870.1 surface antigen BspA-like [Trichomonas vaginalis G3]KAI5504840.1 ribonuclease inhibitor domain-containing protein [Trichomonas vaginalis G3]|eukprot:XP_001312800.1 surface antigen BspA-like [Trichomonas vaginalis G3]